MTEERKERRTTDEVTMRGATAERAPTRVEEPMPEMRRSREIRMIEAPWRATTGGILSIVAGAINIMMGAAVALGGIFTDIFATGVLADVFALPTGVGIGVALMVLGLISIIGGALAMRRSSFSWAVAGSIAALFPTVVFLMGLLSLIFVVAGRNEFSDRMARY